VLKKLTFRLLQGERLPKRPLTRRALLFVSFLVFSATFNGTLTAQNPARQLSAIDTLALEINKVLVETRAPGVGIALVKKDGPIWVAGLGKADISKKIMANENTMYRIASVSKMFVALAILKLQEEGKLNLQDKIRAVIPEIKFENQWEGSYPVRIVHLLEHTTGWDEIHLVELAHTDSAVTLLNALNFHSHTRTSGWPPGSRKAYTNAGYAVAAYIVQKISGIPYETYIKEHFFVPLNMTNTTFLNDDAWQKLGAVTYNKEHEPIGYRHVLYRAAASINSSPREMANLLQFFLNAGTIDTLQLISKKSILRMEVPQSTPGAMAGLQLGYGLGNFTSVHNGFVYNGHEGSLDGGLSELAYLRDHGIGHVILLNETNGEAIHRISKLIRNFETRGLTKEFFITGSTSLPDFTFNNGYYVTINPGMKGGHFMDYLIGAEKIHANGGAVYRKWIFSNVHEKFIPVSNTAFRLENTDKIAMVKAVDPLVGEVLYFDKLVMKPISSVIVYGQLALLGSWIFFMVCGFVIWMGACIQSLIKSNNRAFMVLTLPCLTSLMFLLLLILTHIGFKDTDMFFAQPGIISVFILLLSILIPLSSLGSLLVVYRASKQTINRLIFSTVAALSGLHLLATTYLIYFEVFPIITWS
jgi:CubicO group peptidase (beta-lactamase class C family)